MLDYSKLWQVTQEGHNFFTTSCMRTEKEKMLAGELYNPLDEQLSAERLNARLLLAALNETREDETAERSSLLRELLPNAGEGLWLQPPFYCDYGYNIKLGEKGFLQL